MSAAVLDRAAPNPVLLDPRRHLSASQIVNLRKLDAAGRAMLCDAFKRRPFYMCDGVKYRRETFQVFVDKGLAIKFAHRGNVFVQLNYAGRTVVELLRTARVPGSITPDD